eukprot:6206927-Pleurochrysis_carterae.AAC.1
MTFACAGSGAGHRRTVVKTYSAAAAAAAAAVTAALVHTRPGSTEPARRVSHSGSRTHARAPRAVASQLVQSPVDAERRRHGGDGALFVAREAATALRPPLVKGRRRRHRT